MIQYCAPMSEGVMIIHILIEIQKCFGKNKCLCIVIIHDKD